MKAARNPITNNYENWWNFYCIPKRDDLRKKYQMANV
jgi:hypothetical protein